MPLGMGPVARVARVYRVAIRERDDHRPTRCGKAGRFDSHCEHVARRVHPRPHLYDVAVETEATGKRPGPQIQTLLDLLQILGPRRRSIPLLEREADSSERQPMWVLTKPRSGRGPLTIGIRHR